MQNRIKVILIIAIVVAIILLAWVLNEKQKDRKVVFYQNNDKTTEISVKIADEPLEREKGLMYQKALPENRGMLFVFPKEDYYSFWMKNTLIPLDIIFLNKNKNIVSIIKNVPPCKNDFCPLYQPKEKSQYVIEVNAGFCDKYNIHERTRVKFEL